MAIPLHTKTIDPERGSYDPRGLVGRAATDRPVVDNAYLARALQIASVLQTTLDVEQIIELFSTEVGITIPHNSVAYENEVRELHLVSGTPAPHSCTYRLVVMGTVVGQLTLTRGEKFSTRETQELEYLLCSLVYPLLNALKYREAVESSRKDSLTGLYNRSAMDEAIHREINLAHRHKIPLSLVVLDIDDFKAINDGHGHSAGDMVIRCVAGSVADCIRDTDVLSRYGGEEFTVLLNNTNHAGALRLAERICRTVENFACTVNGEQLSVTVSLGVACLNEGDTGKCLFERADKALYRAKSEGKNCVRLSSK